MQKPLQELLTTKNNKNYWPIGWRNRTCIMGVINITPDSFSDGGLYLDECNALNRIRDIVNEGSDIIDIGAQSTRPGSIDVGSNEELKRIIPILIETRKNYPEIIISVDTFHSDVAEKVLDYGADWINDVSAGRHDPRILEVVANANCPYVLTHSRGNSLTMNNYAKYKNVSLEVKEELLRRTELANKCGILSDNIIWDPGIGFAKNTDHNIELIKNLNLLKKEGYPLLVGPSRKRFIGDITKEKIPANRIWGTNVIVSHCVKCKVDIVRVHEIKPTLQTILMADSIWR